MHAFVGWYDTDTDTDTVKVGVEEVKDAEALVLVPTDEVILVRQTLNTFFSWPTHLVKHLSEQLFYSHYMLLFFQLNCSL